MCVFVVLMVLIVLLSAWFYMGIITRDDLFPNGFTFANREEMG